VAGDETSKDAVRYIKNTKDAVRAKQNDQTPKFKAINVAVL
jgi:hypothetical protein